MTRAYWCGLCNEPHAPKNEPPRLCPHCDRETRWRSLPKALADATGDPGDETGHLSANDYRLLRSFRIAPD